MVLKRTVKNIMTQTVITVKEDMILTDVIKLLLRWHISGVPVVDDDNNLLGIISEHDVVNFTLSGNAADTKAQEVMTKQVETCAPDTLFVQIVNNFASRHIRRIPVVENGKVVGIISRRDIIREMDRIYSQF
ncbi:CBS domain-containing protein [Chloroflexota bacterium]